jgi:4-hydroxymandelate oxidase
VEGDAVTAEGAATVAGAMAEEGEAALGADPRAGDQAGGDQADGADDTETRPAGDPEGAPRTSRKPVSGSSGRRPAGGGRRQADEAGPLNLAELEALAAERLDAGSLAYYSGAATDEVTLRDNIEAFRRWRIRPRVMIDGAGRDPTVEVLGRRWPTPVGIAPLAAHQLGDPTGEIATARACASRGITMCLSTVGSVTIEDVAAVGGPRWFQLYPLVDPGATESLLGRAAAAGYEAIVFTVDTPILGQRERDVRAGFVLPPGFVYPNIGGADDVYGRDELATSYTWHDLEWVVGISGLPVIVKGILDPADAVLAFEHGASGVIVSNHGGRQLDLSVAALDALPGVAQAVGDRGPVLFDSGIRRGTDVLMALALGARAVLLGRPVLWALAWKGEAGVGWALDQIAAEFELALKLAGVERARDLRPGLLVRPG